MNYLCKLYLGLTALYLYCYIIFRLYYLVCISLFGHFINLFDIHRDLNLTAAAHITFYKLTITFNFQKNPARAAATETITSALNLIYIRAHIQIVTSRFRNIIYPISRIRIYPSRMGKGTCIFAIILFTAIINYALIRVLFLLLLSLSLVLCYRCARKCICIFRDCFFSPFFFRHTYEL